MPFDDVQSVVQYLAVVIGCAIFLRVVGREKHRREILLDVQPRARSKPLNAPTRNKKSIPDTVPIGQAEAIPVAQVVNTSDPSPVR